jgi:cell division protein FtsB
LRDENSKLRAKVAELTARVISLEDQHCREAVWVKARRKESGK